MAFSGRGGGAADALLVYDAHRALGGTTGTGAALLLLLPRASPTPVLLGISRRRGAERADGVSLEKLFHVWGGSCADSGTGFASASASAAAAGGGGRDGFLRLRLGNRRLRLDLRLGFDRRERPRAKLRANRARRVLVFLVPNLPRRRRRATCRAPPAPPSTLPPSPSPRVRLRQCHLRPKQRSNLRVRKIHQILRGCSPSRACPPRRTRARAPSSSPPGRLARGTPRRRIWAVDLDLSAPGFPRRSPPRPPPSPRRSPRARPPPSLSSSSSLTSSRFLELMRLWSAWRRSSCTHGASALDRISMQCSPDMNAHMG